MEGEWWRWVVSVWDCTWPSIPVPLLEENPFVAQSLGCARWLGPESWGGPGSGNVGCSKRCSSGGRSGHRLSCLRPGGAGWPCLAAGGSCSPVGLRAVDREGSELPAGLGHGPPFPAEPPGARGPGGGFESGLRWVPLQVSGPSEPRAEPALAGCPGCRGTGRGACKVRGRGGQCGSGVEVVGMTLTCWVFIVAPTLLVS